LLTVGQLDSRELYKSCDCVIAAIPELVARGHHICYLIVGVGDDPEPAMPAVMANWEA
jgi:glycosyltransferase involved in cell wall biosynthesis